MLLGAPGSTGDKTGYTNGKTGRTRERRLHIWQHIQSKSSSLGKTLSLLETLLLGLEIIPTTYRSTISKTHLFNMYCYLGITVLIKLPIYTRYIWTSYKRCFVPIQGGNESDTRVNSEIHSVGIIQQGWKCTLMRFTTVSGDTLGTQDHSNVDMHSAIITE